MRLLDRWLRLLLNSFHTERIISLDRKFGRDQFTEGQADERENDAVRLSLNYIRLLRSFTFTDLCVSSDALSFHE